jgi:hypothetical protein
MTDNLTVELPLTSKELKRRRNQRYRETHRKQLAAYAKKLRAKDPSRAKASVKRYRKKLQALNAERRAQGLPPLRSLSDDGKNMQRTEHDRRKAREADARQRKKRKEAGISRVAYAKTEAGKMAKLAKTQAQRPAVTAKAQQPTAPSRVDRIRMWVENKKKEQLQLV